MVFIAELFWWFESVKPEFVQPRELQEMRDGTCLTLVGSYSQLGFSLTVNVPRLQ